MKIVFLTMLCSLVTCWGNLTDYSEIYGLFVEVDSFKNQEIVEQQINALEKKYDFQCVMGNFFAKPKKFDQLKGILLFSIVPPKQYDAGKSSDHLIHGFVWPIDPTIGSTFKSQEAVFMRTGDLLFDYNKRVDGKKTLPLILESLDRIFEKNLKASHNYKKPLVILFFNRALRLDERALSR